MTVQEVISEVRHLSFEDRIRLLEFLRQTLSENGVPSGRESSALTLRGVLKPDRATPTDEELANIYTDHLLEKHS